MAIYRINSCDICIGLGMDIVEMCPLKKDCLRMRNEIFFENSVNEFTRCLDFYGNLLFEYMKRGEIEPNEDLIINIAIFNTQVS